MSSTRTTRMLQGLTVIGATLVLSTAASAVIESSCPAPCTVPPKSVLFVRQTEGLLQSNRIHPLSGVLRKGSAKTLLHLDVSALVTNGGAVTFVEIHPTLNGVDATPIFDGSQFNTCDKSQTTHCSVSGTFWWDIDVLEAAHPAAFIGQPLTIELNGGSVFTPGAPAVTYEASFTAQIVKKK